MPEPTATTPDPDAAVPLSPAPSAPPDPPATPDSHPVGIGHTIMAGVVSATVGFTSSFAVVLAALTAMGADKAQAGSGLMILCFTMGLGGLIFSLWWRMPISIAWSTPGAALLATMVAPSGGFPTAVGAFVVTGVLLALCGLIRPLGRAVASIPPPLASAMLAGVLLHLCVAPAQYLGQRPLAIAPVILAWLLVLVLAPRWAVPAALVAAVVVMGVSGAFAHVDVAAGAPRIVPVAPRWDLGACVAIALPLWIVTMTSQNIPGMAVLASYGYRPPLSPPLIYTGAATAAGAFAGGHAINLAAISAALVAGPEANPDPSRRWIGGVACGVSYLGFGVVAGLVTAATAAAPAGLAETVAGLALIGTFAGSASLALAPGRYRDAAAVTVIVAASGVTFGGVGAAFWALLAGLGYAGLTGLRARSRGAARA